MGRRRSKVKESTAIRYSEAFKGQVVDEMACERMETDLDDFKKKNALTLSDARKTRGRK